MPIKLLEAAQRLGLDIKTLHKRMEKLGIEPQVSQEDKRVKVISESDYGKLEGRIGGYDSGIVGASQETINTLPRIDTSTPQAADAYDFMSKSQSDFSRILARLEAIESKIDGLFALLDKAVIASRYISRADVESASGKMPAIPHETRPRRGNGDVPRLSEFAELHGVKARTALDHSRMRLIETKDIPLGNGKSEHYVTKDQQAAIIEYWKSIRYPYKVCPDCPHTEEAQE